MVAPAERLEEAVRPVKEVKGEEPHRHDVEDRDNRVLEAPDHHRADVEHLGARGGDRDPHDVVVSPHRVMGDVLLERARLGDADREMGEVVEGGAEEPKKSKSEVVQPPPPVASSPTSSAASPSTSSVTSPPTPTETSKPASTATSQPVSTQPPKNSSQHEHRKPLISLFQHKQSTQKQQQQQEQQQSQKGVVNTVTSLFKKK